MRRRNWLFTWLDEGGERTGHILSIVATCIAHNVNPRAYLHRVVHCIVHGWPQAKLRDLLPDRMLAEHPELYVGDPSLTQSQEASASHEQSVNVDQLTPASLQAIVGAKEQYLEQGPVMRISSMALGSVPAGSGREVGHDGTVISTTGALSSPASRLRRAPIHGILDALGVRPSSLNEPNALIWVEGPSDATYIRHFLRAAYPELLEYRDFTFGFLGGSLLKHAGASIDPAGLAESLVALFRVHPGSCVVIDSDRDAPDAPLGKPYVARFVEDAGKHGWATRVWITEGREMENYLSDAVLAAVGKCAVPLDERSDAAFTKFEERVKLAGGTDRGGKVGFSKAAVAYMKANAGTEWLSLLGLRAQIDRLAAFIRDRCAPK